MKVLELFSGTGSISKAFQERGHEVYRVDFDKSFDAESHADIETLTAEDILRDFGQPDVI